MEFCSPPSTSSSVSSSPRLSFSSTSTSLSSAFSGSEISSLPSPSLSPAPRETALSEFSSPGAKTNAFFASPFATRPPSPLPPKQTPNASTSTISTVPIVPVIVPPAPQAIKKRDFLWLDLKPSHVDDLSGGPTPITAAPFSELPDDSTPRLPSVTPSSQESAVQEELVAGAIIRARTSPRSRTVSTDNSGMLTSSFASSSPFSQSPISGLPEPTFPHSVSFPGLPPESPDAAVPLLTVNAPKSSGTTLRLVEPLGTGAFSSVWLAEDLSDDPLVLRSRRSLRNLRREGSLSRNNSLLSRNNSLRKVRVPGVRPVGAAGKRILADQERQSTLSLSSPAGSAIAATRLVALKMMARRSIFAACSDEQTLQRTRVSFVREVEVLRHISHPNITRLLTHFTTPSYHVLVLPYVPGGDLLGVVNSDAMHEHVTESLMRRIFTELCKALGWMHGVGLVHRDVKLENLLLTAPFPFAAGPPTGPILKLTDFGLSRFIDTAAPMLSTRCGSEAYAAPELVISGGKYDARETDAWACGVVLYALCVRRLPFGEGAVTPGVGGRIGREGGERTAHAARRHWLMQIARGEWEWPETPERQPGAEEDELRGPMLVESVGARRIVERLLVRDRSRRAKISELWDDPFMSGSLGSSVSMSGFGNVGSGSNIKPGGLISAEVETQSPTKEGFDLTSPPLPPDLDADADRNDYDVEGFDDEDLEGEDEEDDDGVLLDEESIHSIAREEVH